MPTDIVQFGIGAEAKILISLIGRIVSQPVGAVAKPYALWAQPGLESPCRHPDIVVTDQFVDYEKLKLFILDRGHSAQVEDWRTAGQPRLRAVLAV